MTVKVLSTLGSHDSMNINCFLERNEYIKLYLHPFIQSHQTRQKFQLVYGLIKKKQTKKTGPAATGVGLLHGKTYLQRYTL